MRVVGHITAEEPILDAARRIFSLQLYSELYIASELGGDEK